VLDDSTREGLLDDILRLAVDPVLPPRDPPPLDPDTGEPFEEEPNGFVLAAAAAKEAAVTARPGPEL
jgi:hypothetical protein